MLMNHHMLIYCYDALIGRRIRKSYRKSDKANGAGIKWKTASEARLNTTIAHQRNQANDPG